MPNFLLRTRCWLACAAVGTVLANQYALAATPPSPTAAARFLEQASWGTSPSALTQVQTNGFSAYLLQQFNAPVSPLPTGSVDTPELSNALQSALRNAFFTNAVSGQDQLRQRVAFALSQIWVISSFKENPQAITEWYRVLQNDALGNYFDIMYDVTLNPGMGHYLDMANNRKRDPKTGREANENYAREVMQLFTIGLNQLFMNGQPKLDSGNNLIPNYTQDDVETLARVFTGWTYATAPAGTPSPRWTTPLVAAEQYHDVDPKTYLGITVAGGRTTKEDLISALEALFNHPSLPPFVCKQLIQHLVTSNPSPQYVQRVSMVFVSNPAGIRGDMKSVVKAILMDPEARAADTTPPTASFGHLKEPVLYTAGLMRALNAQVLNTDTVYSKARAMGQDLFGSPSVFNYFAPDYAISPSLVGPEFQIHYGPTEFERDNFANDVLFGNLKTSIAVDLTSWQTLAADPNQLADAVSALFFRGQMSPAFRSSLLTALAAQSTPLLKAQTALYLAATAEEYQVSY